MGKGSNIKGLGSSWMKKHTRDLLTYMPIDNRASGKGPGKHGMHKGMAEYGKPKGPGKHHPGMAEYGKPKGPGKHGDGPAQTFFDKAQDALSDLTSYRVGGTNTGSLLDQRNRGNLKRLIPQSDYTINKQKARDSVMNAREQERQAKYPYYAKSVQRQRERQKNSQ